MNLLTSGIINVDGKLWKDQRRFLHDKMRLFGMTQMASTSKIQKLIVVNMSLKYFCNYLDFYSHSLQTTFHFSNTLTLI